MAGYRDLKEANDRIDQLVKANKSYVNEYMLLDVLNKTKPVIERFIVRMMIGSFMCNYDDISAKAKSEIKPQIEDHIIMICELVRVLEGDKNLDEDLMSWIDNHMQMMYHHAICEYIELSNDKKRAKYVTGVLPKECPFDYSDIDSYDATSFIVIPNTPDPKETIRKFKEGGSNNE